MQQNDLIKIMSDSGRGRTWLAIFSEDYWSSICQETLRQLSEKLRKIELKSIKPDSGNWKDLSEDFQNKLAELKVRQSSLICFGACSCLGLNQALINKKSVRSLVLVDAISRPSPTKKERIISTLEEKLPLGLPFKSGIKDFDAKPYLQRIRVPSLIVVGPKADTYTKSEADIFLERMPTAVKHECLDNEYSDLGNQIERFLEVPVKCPQKALRTSALIG